MSLFAQTLTEHLARKLGLEEEDVAEALDSFSRVGDETKKNGKKTVNVEKKKVPETKKGELKSKKNENDNKEKHTCQRIKRGKTDECGENATRSLKVKGKTMWLCGTEKTKCYAAELKLQAKDDLEKGQNEVITKKNPKATTSSKKTTKEPPQKPKSILENVLKLKHIDIITIKTKEHGIIHFDKQNRYLIDKDTKKFYGVLDEDNKTIKEFTKKDVAWIESMGYFVEQKTVSKPKEFKGRDKKKESKSSSSDSEKSTSESSSASSESSSESSNLSESESEKSSSESLKD